MRFQKVSILLVLMALLVAACTASPAELPNTGNDLSPTVSAVVTSAAPLATAVATGVAPLATDAPAVVAAAQAWLASQTGIDINDLQLVSFEQTEWTDSCLGLGGAAESCLQVMVPGWRIVFRSGDQTYEVRSDENGVNMRMVPVQ